MKSLLALAYVVDPGKGRFILESHGRRHTLTCSADPVTQRARVVGDAVDVKPREGTIIQLSWSKHVDESDDTCWPFRTPNRWHSQWDDASYYYRETFEHMVDAFALFNPHLTISLNWFGDRTTWKATDTLWAKWRSQDCPGGSPHWYGQHNMERLIAAYITAARDGKPDRTVYDFLSLFDGLSRKRKLILAESGLARIHLSELTRGDELDHEAIARLLASMKKHSKPVTPKRLGVIGEDHFRQRFARIGCVPESFSYNADFLVEDDSIPCVVESAFAYRGEAYSERFIYGGCNWSAGIKDPFRSIGSDGLGSILAKQRASSDEPIIFALHLAKAHVEYKDRGKTEIVFHNARRSDDGE